MTTAETPEIAQPPKTSLMVHWEFTVHRGPDKILSRVEVNVPIQLFCEIYDRQLKTLRQIVYAHGRENGWPIPELSPEVK